MALKEEFFQLLRADTEFRDAVRREVLTDDLLAVPAQLERSTQRTEAALAALAGAQQRTEVGLAALAAAQQRTDERLSALVAAQERTDERLSALAAAQQRTDERLSALAAAQQRTEEALAGLAAAQQRTEEGLAALTDRMDALTDRMDALTVRMDALTVRMDALTTRMDALTTRMDALTTRMDALTTRMDDLTARMDTLVVQVTKLAGVQEGMLLELHRLSEWQRGDQGRRDGERHERDTIRHAYAIFSGGREATERPQDLDRLRTAVALVAAAGISEADDPFLADVLWIKGERIAVVEVSRQVDRSDVERADQRAATLRSAGIPALAMVIGRDWASDEAESEARSRSVDWRVAEDASAGYQQFRQEAGA